MTPDPKDRKISDLEKEIQKLQREIQGLLKTVTYLQRENSRRRSEINTLSTKRIS